MDVISPMVRVNELTSSSYSAPSCRGSWVIRPVEMRLYHCASHQIRGVCGDFKNRGPYSCVHFLIILFFPQFPFLSHTVYRWTQTKTCVKTTRPIQLPRGERKSKTTCLTSFSQSCHINRSHPSHTQRLCHWIAEEGSDLGKHWRRPGGGEGRRGSRGQEC